MERVWVFDHLAITVARVDFADPALAGQQDVRERGVRIEVRPVATTATGSVYASDARALQPAVCRIDLLESGPGLADRMHWHPDMTGGEPGGRTFDTEIPPDPVGWLTRFLHDLGTYLGSKDVTASREDLEAVQAANQEIAAAVEGGLAWARSPWPDVSHDERGMAVAH